VDHRPLVGGDGIGSVVEGSTYVVESRLPIDNVERGSFEENVGVSGGEPIPNVGMRQELVWRRDPCPPSVVTDISI
jgi:hypothetical protein